MTDQLDDGPAAAMTHPPAGWYPEPGAGERMRWWSGADWTDQYSGAAAHPATVPTGAAERSWGTAWVWVLAFMPWVSAVTVVLAAWMFIQSSIPEGLWLIPLLLPWLVTVAVAALDAQRLRLWGHSAGASWAWSLLGAPVYVILRTLRLRAAGKPAFAPLWTVLANVALAIWAVVLFFLLLAGLIILIVSALAESMS